jgi:hypothetical protein
MNIFQTTFILFTSIFFNFRIFTKIHPNNYIHYFPQLAPDGRSPGRSSTYLTRFKFRLTVACMRGFGEHRRAQIWLSGVSACERSEARRAPRYWDSNTERDERHTGC